jgi:hypothetical protein
LQVVYRCVTFVLQHKTMKKIKHIAAIFINKKTGIKRNLSWFYGHRPKAANTLLTAGFILIAALTVSCNRFCDPENIRSGKSLQHHDRKKMTARVMWTKQYGSTCKVRLMNMKKSFDVLCLCDCDTIRAGSWLPY